MNQGGCNDQQVGANNWFWSYQACWLQGYRFYDSNQTDVKEQGTVTREYPGVEFPLQLSMCLKFYIEYDRVKTLNLLTFQSLESGKPYFMALRSK